MSETTFYATKQNEPQQTKQFTYKLNTPFSIYFTNSREKKVH